MKNKSEIFGSPAEGNAFGLAMQKTGGDYKAAKAMLDASPVNFAGAGAIAAGGLQSNFGLGNPATQVSAFEKLRGIGNQNSSAFSGMNPPGAQPMANTFAFNRMAKINRASPCAKSAKSKK